VQQTLSAEKKNMTKPQQNRKVERGGVKKSQENHIKGIGTALFKDPSKGHTLTATGSIAAEDEI